MFSRLEQAEPCVEIVISADVSSECTSILKAANRRDQHPYVQFNGSERSEREYREGRDKSRRVVIRLPEGHKERPPQRRNTSAKKKRFSRSGLDLVGLQRLYLRCCETYNCPPIMELMENFKEAHETSGVPPQNINLAGFRDIQSPQVLCLCEMLQQNANLRSLELPGVGLRKMHMENLCNALYNRRSCERLNVADNPKMQREGFRFVAILLTRSVLLGYLNVSGIKFDLRMGQLLKEALPNSRLRTLIMHNCGLKNLQAFAPIVYGCSSAPSLQNISFKSNALPAEGGRWIGLLLKVDTLITCLDLRSNQLGDAGCAYLSESLRHNKRLTKLVLYDNQVNPAGAQAIFLAIEHNQKLESLDMSANHIGGAAVRSHLKDVLCNNRGLQSLFLWKTGLGNEDVIALAEALAENTNMLRVELRNNAVGAAGLLALSHMLRMNEGILKVATDKPTPDNDPAKTEYAAALYQEIQDRCAANVEKARQQNALFSERPSIIEGLPKAVSPPVEPKVDAEHEGAVDDGASVQALGTVLVDTKYDTGVDLEGEIESPHADPSPSASAAGTHTVASEEEVVEEEEEELVDAEEMAARLAAKRRDAAGKAETDGATATLAVPTAVSDGVASVGERDGSPPRGRDTTKEDGVEATDEAGNEAGVVSTQPGSHLGSAAVATPAVAPEDLPSGTKNVPNGAQGGAGACDVVEPAVEIDGAPGQADASVA